MSYEGRDKQVETLAWITDDEAEFWTSITPTKKKHLSKFGSNPSQAKKNVSNTHLNLPNGHYFQFNHLPEKESQLSDQSDEPQENQTEQIQQTNNNDINKQYQEDSIKTESVSSTDQEIQKSNKNFLERLLKELTGSAEYKLNESFNKEQEEEYHQIDSSELIDKNNHFNNNFPITQQRKEDVEDSNEEGTVKEKVQSFVEEITEETSVIAGAMDEDTLHNRRSRKAKLFVPYHQQHKQISHQNTV